jgi:hypothetical protein
VAVVMVVTVDVPQTRHGHHRDTPTPLQPLPKSGL